MKPTKKSQSNLTKFYLVLYNAIEAIGWSLLLYRLLTYFIEKNVEQSLFDRVKWLVIIFPNSAILEILHAATGLVPSSPVVTAQQVYSRVLLVCGVTLPTLAAKESIGFTIALFAWSFTEVIRYSYYALNLFNAVPYILHWLRYSVFIVLFPIGLCGEVLLLYAAQQEFGKTGRWSFTLPNCLNFTFQYQYFLVFNLLGFAAGCAVLYKHMLVQRRKALGVPVVDKKLK